MAGHMRDQKGQFRKGFNGMTPVGSSSGKKAKLKTQIKDRRLTTRTASDGVNITTRVRDIGPATSARDRLAGEGRLVNPATVTKDSTGRYERGDQMPAGVRVKLSKNQQARVEARTADLKAGRQAKLANAKPAAVDRNKQKLVSILNDANSGQTYKGTGSRSTPEQQKAMIDRAVKFNADAQKKRDAEEAKSREKQRAVFPKKTEAQAIKHRLEVAEEVADYEYDTHGQSSPEYKAALAKVQDLERQHKAAKTKEVKAPERPVAEVQQEKNNLNNKSFASMTPQDKIDAAAKMHGTGSKQHLAAIKKFGPKPAKAPKAKADDGKPKQKLGMAKPDSQAAPVREPDKKAAEGAKVVSPAMTHGDKIDEAMRKYGGGSPQHISAILNRPRS